MCSYLLNYFFFCMNGTVYTAQFLLYLISIVAFYHKFDFCTMYL